MSANNTESWAEESVTSCYLFTSGRNRPHCLQTTTRVRTAWPSFAHYALCACDHWLPFSWCWKIWKLVLVSEICLHRYATGVTVLLGIGSSALIIKEHFWLYLLSILFKCLLLIRQSRMWGDDRWPIRKEEDCLYRVRSARLGCDRWYFCYGMWGRPRLVFVEPLILNLPNFYFTFLRKEHCTLRGKLSFWQNLHWLVECNRTLHVFRFHF